MADELSGVNFEFTDIDYSEWTNNDLETTSLSIEFELYITYDIDDETWNGVIIDTTNVENEIEDSITDSEDDALSDVIVHSVIVSIKQPNTDSSKNNGVLLCVFRKSHLCFGFCL